MAISNSYVKLPEAIPILLGGWPTPLKNDGRIVNWDDDIPFSEWKFAKII